MQSVSPDIPEIHLPERWAVLEQALRQMSAEDAEQSSLTVEDLENNDAPNESAPRRCHDPRDPEDIR